jgi:hypothetical protein
MVSMDNKERVEAILQERSVLRHQLYIEANHVRQMLRSMERMENELLALEAQLISLGYQEES